MVPLRAVGIAANVAFISYGILFGSLPTVVLHAILLPLNAYRLIELLRLVSKVEAATAGDLSMECIKPFMHERAIAAGETLFHKGDPADRMFFVVSGKLRLHEIDIELAPGAIVGELGLLAPGRRRTQTLECVESGTLLEIGYDKIE